MPTVWIEHTACRWLARGIRSKDTKRMLYHWAKRAQKNEFWKSVMVYMYNLFLPNDLWESEQVHNIQRKEVFKEEALVLTSFD